MKYINRIVRRVLLLGALAASTGCFAEGDIITVGVGGSGENCTESTIQAAIDRAARVPGADQIRITTEVQHSAQKLTIGQQDVVLIGGYTDCWDEEPDLGQKSIISGGGGSEGPVFTVNGSGVREFHNLVIKDGDNNGGGGGGIKFTGTGDVRTFNTIISGNRASSGGGISASNDPSGPLAVVVLGAGTRVSDNSATGNGGGVELSGNIELTMEQIDTTIYNNKAVVAGGGLFLTNGADAEIRSAGYAGIYAAFERNDAAMGGAIAVAANEGDSPRTARLVVNGLDHRPVHIRDNTADLGGGLYLSACTFNPGCTNSGSASARLSLFSIVDNEAGDGGAIYVNGTEHVEEQPRLKILPCVPDHPECNVISNNTSQNAYGIIHVHRYATLDIDATIFSHNQGGAIVEIDNPDAQASGDTRTPVRIGTSVMHHNATGMGPLFLQRNRGDLNLIDSTIARNTIGGPSVFAMFDGNQSPVIGVARTVIDQPGRNVLSYNGQLRVLPVLDAPNLKFSQNMDTTLDRDSLTSLVALPTYIDADFGDFGFRPGSRGVDYASATSSVPDIKGQGRPKDVTQSNGIGPYDVGAYELQDDVQLVMNGSFDYDLRAWNAVGNAQVPNSVLLDPYDLSHYQEYGYNSARVHVASQSSPAEFVGLRQCIPVPANPTLPNLQLSASAVVQSTISDALDTAVVEWKYRADSTQCEGEATSQGELILPRGGLAEWKSGGTRIIPPSWTANATMELLLKVRKDPQIPVQNVYALFDGVSLIMISAAPTSAVFKDGFE